MKQRKRKNTRKRKKRVMRKRLMLLFICIFIGWFYRNISSPFIIGLDPGHGGADVGAQGIIPEVELTETTVKYLETILEKDGRFRVKLSRKYGEGKEINPRNSTLKRADPDIVLSIHGNADDSGHGTGFECYPAPPGRKNHGASMIFAQEIARQMERQGSTLRGTEGIRFGYYIPDGSGDFVKTIVEAQDTTVYEYGTFGILEGMPCPSVLVEQCFITNAGDVAAFATEEGCKKAAFAYYWAICRYLGVEPRNITDV